MNPYFACEHSLCRGVAVLLVLAKTVGRVEVFPMVMIVVVCCGHVTRVLVWQDGVPMVKGVTESWCVCPKPQVVVMVDVIMRLVVVFQWVERSS